MFLYNLKAMLHRWHTGLFYNPPEYTPKTASQTEKKPDAETGTDETATKECEPSKVDVKESSEENETMETEVQESETQADPASPGPWKRPRLKIIPLPCDLDQTFTKRKFFQKFDLVYFGNGMAHRVKDVKNVLAPEGQVVVETAK